jgi:3'-phosphoadenosine 5'-phosphosulfate sulfotransferase (PAPS reductase)/FAD synthetase
MCRLTDDEADLVRGRVVLREEDLKKLIQSCDVYVLFSGGLDSLCTLHYSRSLASSIGKQVTAIHVDTTVGFPEVTSHVSAVCRQLGVDLAVVRPEIDYFTLANKWGIPAFNSRWCCRELKIRPITEFLGGRDDPKIVIDGIRGAESSVRAKYLPLWFHPSFRCLSVSPIFSWGDREVKAYIEHQDLDVGPCATLGCSGECWCGAYKTRSDFEALLELHPEIYAKLVEVEERNAHGFTFIYEDGTRTSLRQLKAEIASSGQ